MTTHYVNTLFLLLFSFFMLYYLLTKVAKLDINSLGLVPQQSTIFRQKGVVMYEEN